MPVPNGLTAAALTGAGYTLSSGVYSRSFGSIVVSITLSTEAAGSGFAASVNVQPNGDVSAADQVSASASLLSLGFTQFGSSPSSPSANPTGNSNFSLTGAETPSGFASPAAGYWQTA